MIEFILYLLNVADSPGIFSKTVVHMYLKCCVFLRNMFVFKCIFEFTSNRKSFTLMPIDVKPLEEILGVQTSLRPISLSIKKKFNVTCNCCIIRGILLCNTCSAMGYPADGGCERRQGTSCEDNSERTHHLRRVPGHPVYQ